MERLVLGVVTAWLAGCSARVPAPQPDTTGAPLEAPPGARAESEVPMAPSASVAPPASPPSCALGLEVRVALTQASTGLARGAAPEDLSVARAAGRTLVVLRVSGDAGCDHDGCHEGVPLAFELRGAGAGALEHLESSAIGISPRIDVAALPTPEAPLALTQGHAGVAPQPNSPEPARLFLSAAGQPPSVRARGPNGGRLAATWAERGAIVLIAGWEPRSGGLGPPSVRVMPLPTAEARPKLRSHVLAWGVEARHRFDAPRLVAAGGRAVALFARRQSAGEVCDDAGPCVKLPDRDALQGVWLDPTSAAPRGKPLDLWVGPVEEPVAVLSGAALAVAWSTNGELRGASWREGEPPRAVPVGLPGRTVALAGLARGHLALASGGPRGVEVRVAAGLDEAGRAQALAATAADAREVRLALDERGEGHLVWLEASAVVARPLTCR